MIDLIIGLVVIWLAITGIGIDIWISYYMWAGIWYLFVFQTGFWLYAAKEIKNFRNSGTNKFKE